nr:thermonuclease family protein [Rhizobium sp. CG5]
MLVLALLIIAKLDKDNEVRVSGAFDVVDGDTLSSGGGRLRLSGIDAPELTQLCGDESRHWPCGQSSRRALSALMGSAAVTCSGTARDRYDRLLVVCRSAATDINAQMVLTGMAVAYGAYQAEERMARDGQAGLWSGAFERPDEFRRRQGLAEEGLAGQGLESQGLLSILKGMLRW